MATTTTTLSAAVTVSDTSINLTSLTSVAAGYLILVDDEFMKVSKAYNSANPVPVMRGQLGTASKAHASGANATHGVASDWASTPAQGSATLGYQRVCRVDSYSAAGAITLPDPGEDLRVVLNGTDALAMTIADPGEEIDGAMMYIVGNGTAAHTLTFASGLGGESTSYDVLTFNSGGPVALGPFIACNGYWNLCCGVAITGTVTNITAGLA